MSPLWVLVPSISLFFFRLSLADISFPLSGFSLYSCVISFPLLLLGCSNGSSLFPSVPRLYILVPYLVLCSFWLSLIGNLYSSLCLFPAPLFRLCLFRLVFSDWHLSFPLCLFCVPSSYLNSSVTPGSLSLVCPSPSSLFLCRSGRHQQSIFCLSLAPQPLCPVSSFQHQSPCSISIISSPS